MISVENLHARIDGQDILTGIDLHLQPSDIYGLLGPNGAGKTSTVFVLLGLHQRSGGQVSVMGKDPADQAVAIRRTLGVMPEDAGFYDWMTAANYLQWYAQLYGEALSDIDLCKVLERVGLGPVQDRPIGSYSRGMKQRLAVARALTPHPRLLILDEPTNGLDPKGRREIHDILLDFVGNQGASILLCTHLLDDVDRLCNRIGIIAQGRTLLEKTLNQLLLEDGAGKRFRVRLERPPDPTSLPAGLTLLAKEGDWWRLQLQAGIFATPSIAWRELWQRGWRIVEIRSEASGLEELYLNITARNESLPQEETI
jgi:ABC-2 type transport system ATP-binding protein